MKTLLEIVSITLVVGGGYSDVVILDTNLPSGVWPFTGTQTIRMDLAAGTGEEYIKTHFGSVPLKIIK